MAVHHSGHRELGGQAWAGAQNGATPRHAYHRSMHLLLAAKVWHYWLSFAIFGTTVLVLIAFGIGYLV
jgi:hypothetical protein